MSDVPAGISFVSDFNSVIYKIVLTNFPSLENFTYANEMLIKQLEKISYNVLQNNYCGLD